MEKMSDTGIFKDIAIFFPIFNHMGLLKNETLGPKNIV
jgi:hypothetical protein